MSGSKAFWIKIRQADVIPISFYTLTLPESLLNAAETQAQRDARPLEAVLLDWLSQGADLPVSSLSDAQVLELTHSQLSDEDQARLSALLETQRESALTPPEAGELARLMNACRRGLLRKAEAYRVAVERVLIPPLN